ncbi:TrkA C-terminal domain-containing protein [Lactococcus protaetiae]|uniref:GntR family transcriptional regulator n=1 Tax=Lactococcus protaetiae TaxID=2592653 RepID=A0A514Z8X8_9LACT|nr:TrkA C-terminal domain-containing protein [Lactococcus protaetiae]MCL2112776.1 GntR family transcriptional regulator [Streptococcaceae bacterium]QDK71059.1 GntR family transcriptional regulator [Lactococcus protaetiae]
MKEVRQPRYQQIAILIAEKIVHNELKVGQKIYARSTLATTFGVSSETARKAISVLGDLGIVDSIHGSGVVIASRQKAQEYLAQYQEVKSIQDLQTEILKSVSRQQKELANFSSILDKLVGQTEHFQKSNPMTPIEFELAGASEKLGKTLGEMSLWQNTGATVIAILQNDELVISPGPYATINQGDTLYFVGTSDTLQILQNFFYTKD